jgi:hypothetical protein
MRRTLFVKTAIAGFAVASLVTVRAAGATTIDGVIKDVELRDAPRHITVRSGSEDVMVRVANRTNVDFGATDQGYFSPELSSLRPGMEVHATFVGDEPATRISVVSVPSDLRRQAILEYERTGRLPATSAADVTPADHEMKVRLLDVNRGQGTFKADVAGRSRVFRAEDPKLLARFDEGDLVIVRVRDEAGRDDVVTDIRSSAITGRILDVDHTAGRMRVDVDGRTETFKIDRLKGFKYNEGDRIRFQFEERDTGERVITRIERD